MDNPACHFFVYRTRLLAQVWTRIRRELFFFDTIYVFWSNFHPKATELFLFHPAAGVCGTLIQVPSKQASRSVFKEEILATVKD